MERTNAPTEVVDVELWPHQYEAVFGIDHYRWVFEIGGRGSGKTFKDKVRIIRWAELCTELAWGLFAATDDMLQSALADVCELLDAMGIAWVYGERVPQEWVDQWDRDGIKYPAVRLRGKKFLVLETGAFFFTGSLINNAYTRAKGIDFNGVLIIEGTEPGVTLKALVTLWGGCRCGKARRGDDGVWRCMEPGHLHQLILEGNVPLNDPSHWIYKKDEQMERLEAKRKLEGKPPFYRRLSSATKDNPATGADYDEGLRAAFDEATYIEQTSGQLKRNVALLTYHAFSEKNILDTLVYDPKRPLHMWFDWNATPAVCGFGHDLQWNEVPEPERRKGKPYFGIIGELFSDNEPMDTLQVAEALLTDRGGSSGTCAESGCHHPMVQHTELHNGFACSVCAWTIPNVTPMQFCSGQVIEATVSAEKYLRVPPNWHGLLRHRAKIHIYGDANDGRGNAASIAGGSIKILRDMFGDALDDRCEFHIPNVNPLINLRVVAVNRGFRDGNGQASVFVHSRCEAHIADFREVVPDPAKTGEPLKIHRPRSNRREVDDYSLRTHASDGWGYHWSWRHPYIRPKSDGMPLGQGDEFEGPFASGWVDP